MSEERVVLADEEFAALIGIDWGDREHAVSLLDTSTGTIETSDLAHTPEALREWARGLRERFGGRPIAVCLELSKGPLIYALMEHAFLVLYPINPMTMKKYRDAFCTSGAKDDPTDALLLLDILSKHREHLRPWEPDDPLTRKLRRLTEDRRKLVDDRTALTQRLGAVLKDYFPQALDLVGKSLYTITACDFLLKWPTLADVQRARERTIRTFYQTHGVRSRAAIEQRLEMIKTGVPLTTDEAIVESSVSMVRVLAEQLHLLAFAIARYEKEIETLFRQHPDSNIFRDLPGAGAALAPRLLVAFGSDRDRFRSAIDVQTFSGIAPIKKESGKSLKVIRRWKRPKFLHQTFLEFADQSRLKSPWAKAYYQLQKDRGKSHWAAVRALAFKWIRILFRCWQDRTFYDELRYLDRLTRKGSPIVAKMNELLSEES
jgi:transposase